MPASAPNAAAAAGMPAIVLAGERAGGNALARAHGLSASILVEVNGIPAISRVLAALRGSTAITGGRVVGPRAPLPQEEPALRALFAEQDFLWLEPAAGPSASALAASRLMNTYPVLLTAADHALLTPAIVDEFCTAACNTDADFVVGLVPWTLVHTAYPHSRRTRLRFSDSSWCGSNLFLLRTPAGVRALEFWRSLEHNRKRPWRMAGQLGVTTLWQYVRGKLTITDALQQLSACATARVAMVQVNHARAAVDVDSEADLTLATEILHHESA